MSEPTASEPTAKKATPAKKAAPAKKATRARKAAAAAAPAPAASTAPGRTPPRKRPVARPSSALPPRATAAPASTAATAAAGAAALAGAAAASAAAALPDLDEAIERVRELQDKVLEAVREGGGFALDAYEQNLEGILELTQKAAASTNLDWAMALAGGYADFVKRVSESVLKAGRSALR